MSLRAVITTIQQPTESVRGLVSRLEECNARLIVAGDSKGPDAFSGPQGSPWPVDFLPLSEQEAGPYRLAAGLPHKHYARKNIAYLRAMADGATCIYETDDDNAPLPEWVVREEKIVSGRLLTRKGWANVYRCFSGDLVWPRGLPLDEIRRETPTTIPFSDPRRAPIQQGLVNGSADVDAIWRLLMDREFFFDRRDSVLLEPGTWCPFNTQSTWWWPVAYPLLYVPSHCSFRMCDIWKSFIAQRCLWELGLGIVFHAPEVYQDRNIHDLMRDFRDEIPGYDGNRRLCGILDTLTLESGEHSVPGNLHRCYMSLVAEGFFPVEEMLLLEAWLADCESILAR